MLAKLQPPSILEQDNEIMSSVTQILDKVKINIQIVADYVCEITTKLDDVRDIIKEYDIEIAVNLQEIIKEHMLPESKCLKRDLSTVDDNSRITIAQKKLKHFRNKQLLGRQDHALKELIAKTEEIVLKSETQVDYCKEDIANLEEHLVSWTNTLEQIEVKKLRLMNNEKSYGNNDTNKSNDTENERVENVIGSDETECFERQHPNWQKWPLFVYDIKGTSRFNQRICCVILATPGSLNRSDISCEATDSYHLIDNCLEFIDEQAISGLITINANEEKSIKFEVPILVYIPVVSHNSSLIPTIKYYKGDCWAEGVAAPSINIPDAANVSFIGASIPVRDLVCLQCIAVARYRRHEVEVDEKGLTYELHDDRNIKISIPPMTFPNPSKVLSKIVSWNKVGVGIDAQLNSNLKYIKVIGSYLEVASETVTKSDIEVILYNLGWFLEKEGVTRLTTNQETLYRCSRWITNNMKPIMAEHIQTICEDAPKDHQVLRTMGDKNRLVLHNLISCNDTDFDNFIQQLEKTNQQHIIEVLNRVKTDIVLAKSQSPAKEINFRQDHQFYNGKLYVILKSDDKEWKSVLHEQKPMNPKSRVITLEKGHCIYKIISFTSSEELTSKELENAAYVLDEVTYLTKVKIICRQNEEDLHDVIIHCTKSCEAEQRLAELDDRGYTQGPSASEEFGLIDGEEIEIRFEHNIQMTKYKLFPLKIKYFANIEPMKFSGRIDIVDINDQRGDATYHGQLVYKVTTGRFDKERKGTMHIHFPKELEENIEDFVHTGVDPVRLLAKHIAWQQTYDNFYSTRWVTYAGNLVQQDMPTYRQIIRDIDEYESSNSERDRCEAFILRWSSHYSDPNTNKIEKILEAQSEKDTRQKANQFIMSYLPPFGYFTNERIEKIAYIIARDWKIIAEKLNFINNDISRIISSEDGLVRQAMRMLEMWRILDAVVMTPESPLIQLCDISKSLNCHNTLVEWSNEYGKNSNDTILTD
ncbi:unnamed protein product [Mytilus coruscus]|uniref:Death domain-containing protein n=1 Tax=Mytilus coruscus TaxID=42192 RepID=A0A6J8BDU5_MYTCO|nr:unnamed protein product [Mytilus coruscus]